MNRLKKTATNLTPDQALKSFSENIEDCILSVEDAIGNVRKASTLFDMIEKNRYLEAPDEIDELFLSNMFGKLEDMSAELEDVKKKLNNGTIKFK